MKSFVILANEYLSNYDVLTRTQKKSYQNRLHVILIGLPLSPYNYHQTYLIGGTWGQSWTLSQLYSFYKAVIINVEQKRYPGVNGIGKTYDLPLFSSSPSSDPHIREIIQRELFGTLFQLPPEMYRDFPVIFKSDPQVLNVHHPVVSKPFVDPSANWTHLAAMSNALLLATPRGFSRNSLMYHTDLTPDPTLEIKPIEICTPPCTPRTPRTPYTPRLPEFSKWLLFKLFSQEFLQFLRQQSEQIPSQQLTKMFNDLMMYQRLYSLTLFDTSSYQNSATIHNFFQALNECPVVKTALELYHGKPLDGWMDIQIVTDSNEENQKRFYEFLMMIINLKVWLCHDANKPEFSAECAGKLWVFDDKTDSFNVYDLPEPANLAEQLQAA